MNIENQSKIDKVFLKLSAKHAVLSLLRLNFLILRHILSLLLLKAKKKHRGVGYFPMFIYF